MKPVFLFILLSVGCSALANKDDWKTKTESATYIHQAIKVVTDAMVYDIYSPPVAGRTYAYISIAGYEALIAGNPAYHSLAGQLHGLSTVPLPPATDYSPTLAAVQAILAVGKTMVVSEERIQQFSTQLWAACKKLDVPATVVANSMAYGNKVAQHILNWAVADHYKETRTLPRFSPATDAGTWQPTPPAYMKAVEPHWNQIRTFLLDSAQQFKPRPATPFSSDTGSSFYKEAAEVQAVGNHLTEEQTAIAKFWDCNPFKMNVNGHVMYASKKISPGGHWINIARLACIKSGADAAHSAEVYACLAITIADAFISCWDEKYRSNVIRPETYINQYMDQAWMPLLQTPPFPEYTSGHSVVSTASALMLTHLFGDHFSFADSSEVEFDLPVRQFQSFREASDEAAISRLYGGIHYRPSIINGIEEGERIGEYMLQHLKTHR